VVSGRRGLWKDELVLKLTFAFNPVRLELHLLSLLSPGFPASGELVELRVS